MRRRRSGIGTGSSYGCQAHGGSSMRDVIILGSGPAGLTAGVYAARAHLAPLIVDGHEPGGQLTLTTMVENFPGFPEGLLGPDLIRSMRQQAERFGAEFRQGAVAAADLSRRPFRITIDGTVEECRALIIATGASAKMLGLPVGASTGRTRRLHLRHVRRFLLPGSGGHGGRRRRLGAGGGVVPDQVRQAGDRDSSAGQAAGLQDHAGEGLRQPEDRVSLGLGSPRRSWMSASRK